ncbi:shikimate kinase [Clostridium sp. YIM B02551]|uniref:shikimate kinase n=1 Tax=Clostridium sp. YIM B02551 TaxID=2910679 RepID=UPI001EE9E872|nr:shikimate kinase [Clostridium sp. YIM B02551]
MGKNIVLIGMPGCGKTTIGKLVSEKLQYGFVDMDQYIEEIQGQTIRDMFQEGETFFRDKETTACKELSKCSSKVISTGGGVIKRSENIGYLKENSIIIFIDRNIEDIIGDVNIYSRPLLKEGTGKLYELYEERYDLYKKYSELTIINKGSLEEVAEKIVSKIAISDII